MDSKNQSIRDAFLGFQKVYEDIAKLLMTFDSIMVQELGIVKPDNTAIFEASASLVQPRRWLPYYIHRRYEKKNEYPHTTMYIVVFLDFPHYKDKISFPGPVVSCGIINFDANNPQMHLGWLPRTLGMHFFAKDDDVSGSFTMSTKSVYERCSLKPKEILEFVSAYTMAVPLASVTCDADVEKLLSSPLLKQIDAVFGK